MTATRVVVVGAGLAGLETARLLAADGFDVQVFEAASTVGGRVRTKQVEGFTIDRGFQVLFTAYPEVARSLSVEALELQRFPPGAVVCRSNHRSVVADPLRDPFRAIETAFSRDLTLGDKFRILQLRRALSGRSRAEIFSGPDETIESYLRGQGFSNRFVESFAAPFYGGITLDRSLQTSSRVFKFTFRMLTEGAAAVPAAGMQAIPEQLADRAHEFGARIETDTPVESIDGAGPVTVDLGGESVTADSVVIAAGPAESKRLTGVDSIPTTGKSVRTQYFEVAADNPIAEQPRIHLNADGGVPNLAVSLSAVAPSYAPAGRALLAASTPGEPELDPETQADRTRQTVASWYPAASFDDLRLLETVDVPFAQYAQPPGIHESLPAVSAPEGSVFLAGDSTTDSSINGALMSARQAVSELLSSEVGL
ncbi:MAG: NAD(P)/FAD-dependent oxidoreductase [Halodesulfurarchaeum sp.]|nr:NAD(P)/FAD-dependent oxidoreductase [Halodesulfurarchaeum sp.]